MEITWWSVAYFCLKKKSFLKLHLHFQGYAQEFQGWQTISMIFEDNVAWFKILPPIIPEKEESINNATYKICYYSLSRSYYPNHKYPLLFSFLRLLPLAVALNHFYSSQIILISCDSSNYSMIKKRKWFPGPLEKTSGGHLVPFTSSV